MNAKTNDFIDDEGECIEDRTPLDWAIDDDKTDLADLLRKHGGKTGDWLKAGESIHKAALVGHIDALKQQLADGTDVNAKDKHARTPLHFQAYRGHREVAELLIASGADVNARDRLLWSMLFLMVTRESLNC